ncbi:regulatory protein RecX [Gracilinema caldarium]|uniref:regulatory protein RecX n=1 Tax=Gracilinema caldarium TaxID=215591 RepID=UPI0026EB1C68|nr:RecX family transcriptional regulator [Gracilinema caldarium]
MTVLSVKTGADSDILKIGLSDGSLFFIRLSYLPAVLASKIASWISLSANIPIEISEEEYQALESSAECLRAERKALQLIGRAEQSHQGLMLKLEQRGHSEPVVRRVLDRLTDLDLINDRRFAEAWIHTQLGISSTKSNMQLVSGLVKRGLDARTASSVVNELYPANCEATAIPRYIKKKRLDLGSMDRFEIMQTLRKAGFSQQAIRQYLEKDIYK